MTFIQPHKQFNLLNGLIVALVILTVGATFTMVAVYNGIVNAEHNIASIKAQLDQAGAANTTLQNQVVAQLGSDNMSQVAASQGLVQDNHPQYVPTGAPSSLSLQ